MATQDPQDKIWEFVQGFMEKHETLVDRLAQDHLIPGRYDRLDIKHYISGRIEEILRRRGFEGTNNIKNPEKYFRTCLGYYIREFKREFGYIFSLPRRPRRSHEDEDLEARLRKYKYLGYMPKEESDTIIQQDNKSSPSPGELWKTLMSKLDPDEEAILECMLIRNMNWVEISVYLKIPKSTCWYKRQAAFQKIFAAIDKLPGEIADNIRKLKLGDENLMGEL